MTTFDPSKPVQTRDGRPARIISTDAVGITDSSGRNSAMNQPILAAIGVGAEAKFEKFEASGRYTRFGERDEDLVNPIEKIVAYHTFNFKGGCGLGEAGIELGTIANRSVEGARDLLRSSRWDGVMKITTVDGKLTAVEIA